MTSTLTPRALDSAEDLTFSQAIRTLREATGCSARAASLLSDLSESYMGKLEKGEIDPSLRAFARIAKTLALKPSEITFLVNLAMIENEVSV